MPVHRVSPRHIGRGLALLLTFNSVGFGAGWSDDFNDGNVTDGNPVTWDDNLFDAFPGTYDASSGDYAMSNPEDDSDNNQMVTWVDGVSFSDSYIRTQGIVLPGELPEEVGGNLAILGRLDTDTVSAYILYVDSGANLGLQISIGGEINDLVPSVDLPFDATSEIILELNIVGSELSGYAWQPGNPKPTTPLIAASDPTFASGKAGIAYDEDDDNTTGVFRFAAAQDTPFVDTLPGDFNDDGSVDAADYTVWRDGLGTTHIPEQYDEWKQNFGAGGDGVGSGVASVPEPAALCLALLSIVVGVGGPRFRGCH